MLRKNRFIRTNDIHSGILLAEYRQAPSGWFGQLAESLFRHSSLGESRAFGEERGHPELKTLHMIKRSPDSWGEWPRERRKALSDSKLSSVPVGLVLSPTIIREPENFLRGDHSFGVASQLVRDRSVKHKYSSRKLLTQHCSNLGLKCLCGLLAIFFFSTLLVVQANGQDVVVLNADDGKTTKRNGRIVDWKGNRISLETRTRTRTINANRLIDVQTDWPTDLKDARQLMTGGKYLDALPKFQSAREQENRQWVKQIITAEMVQCLDAQDKTEKAIIEFLKLYQHDSQTRFFHLIPLPWLMNAPYREDGRFGVKLIQSEDSLLALIASSLMLSSGQSKNAERRLEQLATDSDSRIAQLATTQLWRREVLNANENTLARWQRQVDRLPDKLRPGPLVLLAQVQSRLGKSDAATTTFMKLPILYPEKKSLSALALYRCGEILQDKGQDKLAGSLQQELYRNYPTSQFAERARQK